MKKVAVRLRATSGPTPGAIFLSAAAALLGLAGLMAPNRAMAAEPTAGPGLLARTWASATDMDAWQGDGFWRVAVAPYAHHFRYSAEHRHVYALAIERQRPDHWLAGVSYFRNSFGQPSSYTYVGKRFPQLWGQEPLFGQLSAGVMYGYRGKYQKKVPANYKGFSPGALVSLGWQFNTHTSLSAHMLGDAGVMFQFAYDWK
jgi:hypothetical protein